MARELAPVGLRSGPQKVITFISKKRVTAFRAASRPSGSKLPRHRTVHAFDQRSISPQTPGARPSSRYATRR
ncbi:hypothetical protein C1X64_22605 [Pseudomonas sp. GW456-E7]|nr:hypothetical protein C1X64_22605 [Pseudomonas sp. GW456-E7]